MRVIATKLGIYGSDRIREGKEFTVPDGEPIPSWAVPVEVYVAPCGNCESPMWVEQVPLLPEATLTECPACERKHVVYQTKGQIKAGRVDMAKTGKAPTVGDEVTLRFQDGNPTKAAKS